MLNEVRKIAFDTSIKYSNDDGNTSNGSSDDFLTLFNSIWQSEARGFFFFKDKTTNISDSSEGGGDSNKHSIKSSRFLITSELLDGTATSLREISLGDGGDLLCCLKFIELETLRVVARIEADRARTRFIFSETLFLICSETQPRSNWVWTIYLNWP